MSVIYQATSTTGWASAASVVVTKPSGLQAGDLMIAQVAWQHDEGNVAITPISDWRDLDGVLNQVSEQSEGVGGGLASAIQYRIATSADEAASNYTWNIASSVNEIAGGIILIRGQHATTPIGDWASIATANSANPTFANTITPTAANSLLVMLLTATTTVSAGTASTGGYAIATSNPSWTERYDFTRNTTADPVMAAATASRPQTTATGDSSVTSSYNAAVDWSSFLIAVTPAADPTLAPAALAATATTVTPGFAVSAAVTTSIMSATASTAAPTISTKTNPWSNPDKSVEPSWSNPDKS